jgi:hypothetical protein
MKGPVAITHWPQALPQKAFRQSAGWSDAAIRRKCDFKAQASMLGNDDDIKTIDWWMGHIWAVFHTVSYTY